MNVKRLELRAWFREEYFECFIDFFVDGENWGQIVRKSFGKEGYDEGLTWFNDDDNEHFVGVHFQKARQHGGQELILFNCGCGVIGCSEVLVDVDVTDTTVTYRNFRQCVATGLRASSEFGPVVFDRGQYEAEWLRIFDEVEAHQRKQQKSSNEG